MKMKNSLELNQSQRITINLQMQKSLQILQLSYSEMIEKINKELEKNPLLEPELEKEEKNLYNSKLYLNSKENNSKSKYIEKTLEQKKINKTQEVLKEQVINSLPQKSSKESVIIAYEPIWAIGTGLTPSLEEIENAHRYIKNLSKKLFNFKIIYGGSVKSKNSKLISKIDIVNGALIGGASLKINEFNQIIS